MGCGWLIGCVERFCGGGGRRVRGVVFRILNPIHGAFEAFLPSKQIKRCDGITCI